MTEENNPIEDTLAVELAAESVVEGTPAKSTKKKVKKTTTKKKTKKKVVKDPEPLREEFPAFRGGSLGYFNKWKGAKRKWESGVDLNLDRWRGA